MSSWEKILATISATTAALMSMKQTMEGIKSIKSLVASVMGKDPEAAAKTSITKTLFNKVKDKFKKRGDTTPEQEEKKKDIALI
jgi:hypothetical protein